MIGAYEKQEMGQIVWKLKYIGLLGVILFICLAGILGFRSIHQNNNLGFHKVPNLTLTSVDGKEQNLSDLRGQMVYIDFWASWCASCRSANDEQAQYLDGRSVPSSVAWISVSLDSSREMWMKAIKEDDASWKSHFNDIEGWQSRAVKAFNVNILPANVLIDENGKVIGRNISGQELQALITQGAI